MQPSRAQAQAGSGTPAAQLAVLRDLMQDTRAADPFLDPRWTDAELVNWPEYQVWGSPDITIAGTCRCLACQADKLDVPRANDIACARSSRLAQ